MNELLRKLLFLPPQASTVAYDVDRLHYFVILTTMCGALLVTLVGGTFLIRFRRGAEIDPPRQIPAPTPPTWMKWTVYLGLFFLFVLWWVIGFRRFMVLRIAPNNAMPVYVTAKQWMWKFSYPEGAHSISTLVVPTGRPVRLLTTSRDVIHSFYVPDFRVKQDVLPGRYSTLWFEVPKPGRHQILCAEYCGAGHSTMRGEVVALEPRDYARWLEGNFQLAKEPLPERSYDPEVVGEGLPREPLELVQQGVKVAGEQGCLRCHTLEGTSHIGPTWAGLYLSKVPLSDGTTQLADVEYLTKSMMDPAAQLHRGFENVMPSYLGRIHPAETAALVELIRSLKDVPPKEPVVPAARMEVKKP